MFNLKDKIKHESNAGNAMLNAWKTTAKIFGSSTTRVFVKTHTTGETIMSKCTRTEWLVNKLFTNRGWELVVKNGKHVLCKRF